MKFQLRLITLGLLLAMGACSTANKSNSVEDGEGSSDVIQANEAGAPAPSNEVYTPPGGAAAPAKTSPQATDALNAAAKRQDWDGLQRNASQILASNSNDPKALAALGLVNAHKGKNLAAMYFYNKSLQVQPNQPEVYTNIGMVQLQMKERKDAVRSFKKALEVGATDGVAAANLGSIYANEGDYFKALPVLDRAIKSGVKDTRIYNNFGVSLAANGRYEEAKEIYEQAIKLGPSNREAHFNLAILLIDHLNQPQPGLAMLEKLRFLGLGEGMRDRINSLENKAKAGLK